MSLAARLIGLALAVVALRWCVLGLTPTDLFFDEAQYWAWGQRLDWGYFSKPPLIGWVIRLVTDVVGSDAPFWVRFAAPLFHGATGVILGLFMAQVYRPAAVWTTALYLSMPILTIGSWMISTDTIMAPFLAAAIWMWWRYLSSERIAFALYAGLLAGVAAMAKYAGAYFFVAIMFGAIYAPPRPSLKAVLLALAGFALVIAPNMIWNMQHGMITFAHTADNASIGEGLSLKWGGLLEFVISQAMVIGPVFFVVWLMALRGGLSRIERFWLAASLPIVLMMCWQALTTKAFANWAFAAYLSAAPLVALRLVRSARWRWLYAGLGLNVLIGLAVSALIVFPQLAPKGADRYSGRSALSAQVLEAAGGKPVVAVLRSLLADLTYEATRDGRGGLVYALPEGAVPHHWYDMVQAMPDGTSGYFLGNVHTPPLCKGVPLNAEREFRPERGAYAGQVFGLYPFEAGCF